jgi:SWI/SNF-related matrix-associated actin-dependent regulator of chromatin subfamily A-like protein 1
MLVSDKATQQATGHVKLTPTNQLYIKFHYDPGVIAKVKTLSNRAWHSTDKSWTAALILQNVSRLKEWGFVLDAEVGKWLREHKTNTKKLPKISLGKTLNAALDGYQMEGIQRVEALGGRALIADDPGLGKTPQALGWLLLHPELRPVVIVSKATGKLVWQRIAKRGILYNNEYVPLLPDDDVQVIYGEQPVEIHGDVIIINYDILAKVHECPDCGGEGERHNRECDTCKGKGETIKLREDLTAMKPAVVILDEPQQICNRDAQRTVATIALAKSARHIISTTASPIKKRPREFFNILNLTRPDIFPSFWNYAQQFCGAKHNGFGWNFNGATNTESLYDILTEHVMIRRSKKEVMAELPLPVRIVVPLEIKNRGEYDRAATDFISWLTAKGNLDRRDRAERAEALVKATTLLSMAAERKTDMVIEWIQDFLESDKKLIVFTAHTKLLNKIVAEFPDIAVKLDGSSSLKERQEAEDKFQEDPSIKLFVGNTDAAGDTITLTAAHDVAFAELPRTPEGVKQNEGRAYGRKNDPHGINTWFLVAADTIEEERAEQLSREARVVNQILDGTPPEEGDDLINLISMYKKKET